MIEGKKLSTNQGFSPRLQASHGPAGRDPGRSCVTVISIGVVSAHANGSQQWGSRVVLYSIDNRQVRSKAMPMWTQIVGLTRIPHIILNIGQDMTIWAAACGLGVMIDTTGVRYLPNRPTPSSVVPKNQLWPKPPKASQIPDSYWSFHGFRCPISRK